MYLVLKYSHILLAVLALGATLAWSAVAWPGAATPDAASRGRPRLCYLLNRATTGLAGLGGVLLTAFGPWRLMLFPYLGLAAFVAHGLAAAASKKHFANGDKPALRIMLLTQTLLLLLAGGLMAVKPL